MSVLRNASLDSQGLTDALRPFWGEGAVTLQNVLGDLTRRAWIASDSDGRYALTTHGEAAHTALTERVQGVRSLLTDGLSEEEFSTTMRALRRMVENLVRALEQ